MGNSSCRLPRALSHRNFRVIIHKKFIFLSNTIADIWNRFKGELFPTLTQDLGSLTANHQRFVAVLDLKPVETFIQTHSYGRGRPLADRRALARSFIAKAVFGSPIFHREILAKVIIPNWVFRSIDGFNTKSSSAFRENI